MMRLSGLDASFLYLETPTQHQHVCATLIMDPATMPDGYDFDRIKSTIGSRLHELPQFRRKLSPVPFNLDHPVWVDDADFDLDYHVRRIGCPAPGTDEQLAEIAADIAGRQLDRARPLWEWWVVEGLENGHIAVVAKMHHCTVDGVSGANMMVHLLDRQPDPPPRPAPPEWEPEHQPSDLEKVGRALVNRARRPLQLVTIVPKTIRNIAGFLGVRRRIEGPGMAAPLTAPRTPFNGAITPHRKMAYGHIPLAEIKSIKNAFGTTVNDVVLAIAGGALRAYLLRNDELPDKSLIATVPVSVRDDNDKTLGTNRVSAIFSNLGTDIEDPVERLRTISTANRNAKEEHKAIGAAMLQDWMEFAAPTTFSLAARFYSAMRLAERHPVVHNLVISNVPGPPFPLYFAGAKLVAMYPMGPVFHGAGLNITVLSYMDTVFWGFMTCREQLPDVWDLCVDVHDALAELQKASQAL
jgi:WS/DGAT/MGAT family acyltransferase